MSGKWYKIVKKHQKTTSLLVLLAMGVSLTAPFIDYTFGMAVNDRQEEQNIQNEEEGFGKDNLITEEQEVIEEQKEDEDVLKELKREDEYLKTLEETPNENMNTGIKNKKATFSTMSSYATNDKYVLATDADFSGTKNGNFRYIGDDEYVEIPHTIKGVNIVSYTDMFNGTKVKGVKSTNKNIAFMTQMFYGLKSSELDVSQLDTTGVTGMVSMFGGGQADKSTYVRVIKGLETFDTSQVTNMSGMFFGTYATSIDVSNFDTSNVTNMANMLRSVKDTTLDVSNFDTSKVTNMEGMFYETTAPELDISNFVTSNVSFMGSMFFSTKATTLDVSGFDTSNVVSMPSMFYGANAEMIDVSNFDTSKVGYMQNMFEDTVGEIKGLGNFNTGNVVSMGSMFTNAKSTKLDVSGFDTSKVTNMSGMFQGTETGKIDVSRYDTRNVTKMNYMFYYAKATDINLTGIRTDNVTDMSGMFRGSHAEKLDLGSFNTSNVTNMNEMFKDSQATTLNIESFNTSKVIDMGRMFMGSKAKALDLSSFNTMRITDMSDMFNGSEAKTINVSGFDTSYVTDMGRMFLGAKVNELDLSSFDMGSVNNTGRMFQGVTTSKGVSRSKADADKLNSSGDKPTGLKFEPKFGMVKAEDFIGTTNGSFKYVGKDEYVEIPHKIRGVNVTSYKDMFENTDVKGVISTNKNVTDMGGMFRNNTSEQLDVGNLDTTGVTNMSGMFQGTNTHKLDLRSFTTDNVTLMGKMFEGSKVNELDLGSFDLGKVTNMDNMFQNTSATAGYARTGNDLEKLNRSKNKPNHLTFTVWSVTTEQSPLDWTNDGVDVKVNATSDAYGVSFVEMVNEPGRNLLKNSHLSKKGANEYLRYDNIAPVFDQWGTGTYTFSFDLKSDKPGNINAYTSDTTANLRKYVFDGKTFKATTEWERYSMTVDVSILTPSATYANLSFYGTYGTGRVPSVRNVKIEKGNKATPWTPSPEDKEASEGVFTVYENGTYIYRATYGNGETRTVAHKVTNIDKAEPTATITKGTSGWTSQDVELTVNAKDDLSGVKSITLPDGKVVNADKATYKATTNGDYTFKVTDNAGNVKSYTEKVTNIDRTIPKLSTTIDNTNWTRDPVNIKVTSEESASGLVDITMINSPKEGRNLLRLNKESRTIKWNGWDYGLTYPLAVPLEDYGLSHGDEVTLSFNVEDTNKPTRAFLQFRDVSGGSYVQYNGNLINEGSKGLTSVTAKIPTKTSQGSPIGTVYSVSPTLRNNNNSNEAVAIINSPKLEYGGEATPWTPAPEDIPLINNTKTYPVVANGLYTFESTYNNGATSEVSVNITNIDREPPTIKVKGNPTEYTEDDEITLEVTVEDSKSGVDRLTLPNGTTTTNKTTTLKVKENGDYTFTAVDKLGNTTTHKEKVDKIMVPYKFYLYDNNGNPFIGVKYELLRDGNVHSTSESDATGLVDFGKVPQDGKYSIRQVKVPGGGVVNPGEQEVDVGDTTEPEEFISYPRGKELPGTGTKDSVQYVIMLLGVLTLTGITRKRVNNLK